MSHIESLCSNLKGLTITSELKSKEVVPIYSFSNIEDFMNDFTYFKVVAIKNEPNIFRHDDEDNGTYQRYSIEHPKKCVIPDDMYEFYTELNTFIKNNKNNVEKTTKKYKFYEPCCSRDSIARFDSLNLLEGTKEDFQDFIEQHDRAIHLYDYFKFFTDPYSIDNGCGCFLINLNIDSIHYGHVYAYSSNDEGTILKMVDSFSEFIDLLLYNIDLLKKDPEYPRASICDIFAYYDTAKYPGYKTKSAK